jgi:uncharacterized protein with HEPN domain
MSKSDRNVKFYLLDILEAINDILEFVKDFDYESFTNDKKTVYAVIRCFEVIGEAVKHIPDYLKQKYPHVPWKEVAGMRDKLIHEYFGVDVALVWDTIQEDVIPFKQTILEILKKEFE